MQNITHRHLDPKTFKQLTQWSIYKISRETDIPVYSLYNYLKAESDPKYREPKLYIKRLLGEIYSRLTPEWVVAALSLIGGGFFVGF